MHTHTQEVSHIIGFICATRMEGEGRKRGRALKWWWDVPELVERVHTVDGAFAGDTLECA